MATTVFPSRRSGFTLLELLVVIGIIGILSGVMLATFGGASESAKAVKCMTNMRNLAVAAYNYASGGNSDGDFPAAGSYEYNDLRYIRERVGWISWLNMSDPNPYNQKNGKNTASHVKSSWTPYATYQQGSKSDMDKSRYALTNGVLWQYAGRTAETYVCPVHDNLCKKKKLVPTWSYVMNSYFGYDHKKGGTVSDQDRRLSNLKSVGGKGVRLGGDKILLFAELPFVELEEIKQSGILQGSSPKFDCTLQYDRSGWSEAESIGFNHKNGKNYVAHVAFADGHVTKLTLPKNANASTIKDLTTWLCQGDDVSFDGKTYTRVQMDSGTK